MLLTPARRIFLLGGSELALSFYITTISVALLIAVAAFIFHNHWMERHGDNHF
jgi:hypothetical protein